ncbi:MAG: beta-hydroxyacyl-ACP dehydratase [Bacteriovoracaceae bacterium]|nr:beta-hydroxyacyl-ACP dehydratase [Bacteriovoracaceae bacterium]
MEIDRVLQFVPQQEPFRFIDEIVELDSEYIVGKYTFKENEYFYRGHFPGDPITPGVILTEAMAQTAVVAHGIYQTAISFGEGELKNWRTVFTDCQMEYFKPVYPGQTVTIKGQKVFWRKMKLKSKASMYVNGNELVAEGLISGMGVKIGK